jgi:formylglycine-generating enzyme required for sulfatase activity
MPKQPYWNYDTHPVVNVSWDEANEYAAWIGKRLPGEFEWEFAAKSGALQETHYISFLGKATLGNVADEALRNIKFHYPAVDGYNDGFVYTSPVASFKPNKFGIYDLDGNVLEWCADWYIAPYNAPNNSLAKDKIEAGRYRVIRGVSWNRGRNYIRSTFRTYYPPSVKYDFVGFRCAKDYVESTLASNRK